MSHVASYNQGAIEMFRFTFKLSLFTQSFHSLLVQRLSKLINAALINDKSYIRDRQCLVSMLIYRRKRNSSILKNTVLVDCTKLIKMELIFQ